MGKAEQRDESDEDVPLSERGKGENMPLERRWPSAVFGLVGLSYLAILLFVLMGIVLWKYL